MEANNDKKVWAEFIHDNLTKEEIKSMKCSFGNCISFSPKIYSSPKENNRYSIICKYSRKQGKVPVDSQYNEAYTKDLRKRIYNVEVRCPNNNCIWKGAVSLLMEHKKNKCEFEVIECPKKEYLKRVLRNDLKNHLNDHEKNNNGNFLEDEVKCKYKIYECRIKVHRKIVEDHITNDIEFHIKLLKNILKYINGINKGYHESIQNEILELEKLKEKEIDEKNKIKRIQLKEEFEDKGIQKNQIVNNFLKKPKTNDFNDNVYIPYKGKIFEFVKHEDTSNKKIIEFDPCIIKYSGQDGNINQKYFAF